MKAIDGGEPFTGGKAHLYKSIVEIRAGSLKTGDYFRPGTSNLKIWIWGGANAG